MLAFFAVSALLFTGQARALPRTSSPDSFKNDAKSATDNEEWPKLEELSRARIKEEPGDHSAIAYLSFALAGQKKFDEAVAALADLEEAGYSPTRNLRGVGNPLSKIVNIIYMTCWANFDAGYNVKAWSALFNRFEELSSMYTAASRLLMAALKTDDKKETSRLEAWFEKMLEKNKSNPGLTVSLYTNFAEGYLRAGVGKPRTLDLASISYNLAREDVEKQYENIEDPLERREKCDVNTDDEYRNLALACSLCNVFDPPENRLAEREPEPGAVFEDITAEAGLGSIRSGRVAVADYNSDGYPDLCFSGRLFMNDKGNRFVEKTKEAGISKTGAGALFFDFDNDKDLDLLISTLPHPYLFRNEGKKGKYTFTEVTTEAGLEQITIGATPEGVAAMDIDNDGWLDFYMAAYENPYPKGHPDVLALNNGDGTFSDVSKDRGVLEGDVLCGRGVTCSDYDRDGDVDIHVSNYRLHRNFLWQNNGSGSFVDIGEKTGLMGTKQGGAYGHTIGSCWGDIDNDGNMDLFCANLAHPRFINQGFSNLSMLYVNQGRDEKFAFTEERRDRGIRFQETHSDPALIDYDNDGDLDLYITAIYEGAPSCFYQNTGDGFFEPVTFRSRSVVFNGWGQAWFDMDDDGDLDHLIGSGSGVVLHRNKGNNNKWIKVELVGKNRNYFGVGARVQVTTPEGLSMVREARIGRGTQSQDDPILHFGLGPNASSARIEVTWTTGHTKAMNSKVNKTVTVRQRKDYPKRRQ